ncbi:MAG: hypothetical protein DRJ43_04550 [Thermoprotei archaeon]|nr:MAG: hypothetical protein DRJ43_04550 [Thermoprotei archaeon]
MVAGLEGMSRGLCGAQAGGAFTNCTANSPSGGGTAESLIEVAVMVGGLGSPRAPLKPSPHWSPIHTFGLSMPATRHLTLHAGLASRALYSTEPEPRPTHAPSLPVRVEGRG